MEKKNETIKADEIQSPPETDEDILASNKRNEGVIVETKRKSPNGKIIIRRRRGYYRPDETD